MGDISQQDLAKLNPHCNYAPTGFDYAGALARARAFYASLQDKFPGALLDDQVQDATYHAGIAIGEAEIRLSNFAELAAITSEERLPAGTLADLKSALEGAGYRHVAFEIFGAPFSKLERFNGGLFTQLFDYV